MTVSPRWNPLDLQRNGLQMQYSRKSGVELAGHGELGNCLGKGTDTL